MRRTWAGVQRRPDGVAARICPCSPGAGKDLVGPPAEQEGVGALVDLVEERRGLVVEERQGPSAALESAPAILIRPAEPLHHAVDRDVRGDRQFHGRSSLLVGLVVVRATGSCCAFPNKGRTSAMSYSATDAESICRALPVAGAALRKASTAACDSQRSKRLTRPGSIRSAVMAKSRQPALPRAFSTTLTQSAR